ncbi:hypothetical protein [Vibrio alginolyticus]|uniref:hypothetical protein n=1 Tax=Vibrio alginolyticus TaxID=663 RepID=UPI001BD4CD5A|nr:hypothetical protein [Vibrio alginolyticus]MBS9974354.1 hypothetical protein [Vibrio alginolyticus]MBT0020395.1 hypothetical protein [Vibrio alginolyticus]MCS0039775.1 hypothetical protein [Vibrio alginolyticus]
MEQFKCSCCDENFSCNDERNYHESNCKGCFLKIEPSFRAQLSKKKRRARGSVQGSYEWALRQPLPKNSKKFRLAIDSKYTRVELEKEVLRLEREIAFSQLVPEKNLNRQIVFSHVLKQKILTASKIMSDTDIQNKIDAEHKKLKEQIKRDRSQGSALGDEFDTKYSLFVPGGAPGLGKRA